LGVNVNSALEVFRLVYECVSREEEGRRVSTGFLVGDSAELREKFPDSAGIAIERENILEATRRIRSLFGIVDGFTSAFIVGKDGMLEDARLMPIIEGVPEEDTFASNELHGYCEALKKTPGYGLVALGSFRTAKLFFDGRLHSEIYFSGKIGEWACRPLNESLEKLDQAASVKGIDRRILYKIFSVAIIMSNHRKGGTIIVGDHEEVLSQSEAPRWRLDGTNILDLRGSRESHLFNLSTQEFALVVSRSGELKASSVRLMAKVPDRAKVELAATDGGRHRSAAEITASTDSVALVVSDDGPITAYVEGKRILRV